MNTDNCSISGETIDYGPCAFMDEYNPAQVFSSIDEIGRYAYANQPRIALWNLTRLAECLLPLFSDDKDKAIEQAQFILGEFAEKFTAAYQAGLRRKIGLFTARDGDEALVQDLLDAMAKNQADFTLTFRRLSDAAADATTTASGLSSPIPRPSTSGPCDGVSASLTSRNRPPSGRPRCVPSIRPSSRATTASKP